MSTCEGCQYDFGAQDLILGFCRDCVIDQHSDKIGRLQAEIATLRTDRDELHATLSGLCSYLGAGTPDDSTTAVEINRLIHAGIRRREEAAREKAEKDRDELRRVLEQLLSLYEAPEDEIGGAERMVLNKVRKLLEAK